MASWWKLIATQLAAQNSSSGPYQKRVAFKLGAQNLNGLTWEQKIGNQKAVGRMTGAYGRRMVDFKAPVAQTAYGTAGSWGRVLNNQNLLNTNKPAAGNQTRTPPVGGIGVRNT